MSFNAYDRQVKDEMTRTVVTASPEETVLEALVKMEKSGVNVLPIVDEEDRCVGVFSTSDLAIITDCLSDQVKDLDHVSETSRQWLIEKLAEHGIGARKLADTCCQKVFAIGPDVSISDAGREMLLRRVHHLVIINDQQQLEGIVSSLDLLAAFVKGAPVPTN